MGIGRILQGLLEANNTNVNEVAVATGVHPQTIYSMIKRDSTKASIDDLYKIAHHLGVSLDYFYSNYVNEQKEKDPKPESFEVDERERALVLAYRNNTAMQPAVDRLLGLDFSDMPIPDFQRIKTDAENFTREIMKNQNMPAKK